MDQYSASAGRRLLQNNNNNNGNGGANLGQCWQQFYSVYPARCGPQPSAAPASRALDGWCMHGYPCWGQACLVGPLAGACSGRTNQACCSSGLIVC